MHKPRKPEEHGTHHLSARVGSFEQINCLSCMKPKETFLILCRKSVMLSLLFFGADSMAIFYESCHEAFFKRKKMQLQVEKKLVVYGHMC